MTINGICMAFWSPGPMEIMVILAVLLLLFGRRLPEIARSMGKSLTEFKRGMNDTREDIENSINQADDSYTRSRQDVDPGRPAAHNNTASHSPEDTENKNA